MGSSSPMVGEVKNLDFGAKFPDFYLLAMNSKVYETLWGSKKTCHNCLYHTLCPRTATAEAWKPRARAPQHEKPPHRN